MAPKSTAGIPTPSPDTNFRRDVDDWLNDKRAIDGAEGLWRVHNGLYDVTCFVKSHPGGQFWLEDTKGTDITEAFESHHISTLPESLLKKYYVREAKTKRASPFTFKDDGFYRTAKRNVREALKTIPKNDIRWTKIYTDSLMAGTFIFAVLATIFWSFTCVAICAVFFGLTIIATHNYSHQKDNFRMYYGDVCMQNLREVRIVHVISHHMLTNTVADMQTYLFEPLVNFFPQKKSMIVRYGNLIYQPLLMWPTLNFVTFLIRTFKLAKRLWKAETIRITDLLPYALLSPMYLLGGQSFLWTFVMWQYILAAGGFFGIFVTVTGTHFHPDIFIDGDKPRPEDERDWGINQLDTVSDRTEITGNHFLVLVTFGDHALHHLFPTLDHGVLQHLYPVVEKTMKEFNLNIRMTTHTDMVLGYFRQIAREIPNPNSPTLKK